MLRERGVPLVWAPYSYTNVYEQINSSAEKINFKRILNDVGRGFLFSLLPITTGESDALAQNLSCHPWHAYVFVLYWYAHRSSNSRYRSLSQLGQTTWSTINQTSRGAWTDWSGNQSTWTSVRESIPPAGELTGNSHTADSSKDVGLCVTAAGLAASWLRVQSVTQNGKPFSLRRVCLLVDSFFLLFSDGGLCLSAVVGVDRRMKEKREKEIFHRWCFAIWLCSKIFSCHNCGGKKTCLRFYYKC